MNVRAAGRVSMVIVAVAVWIVGDASGGEQELVLQDHIKIQWTRELVTFDFTADEGQCHRDSVRLEGPKGPVACQLSNVECWPGSNTFVKSAKLSFIADLAPLARDVYTIRYAAQATDEKGPATDLVVKKSTDGVEITTKLFGVKLLLGSKALALPADAATVPGPIVATHRGDGNWFDGSRMFGTTKIVGYSAELVESGPVFAEVAVRYEYKGPSSASGPYGGNTLDLRFHVSAGGSGILIDANVKQDDPSSGWEMVVSPASQRVVWRMIPKRKGSNPWKGMPKYAKRLDWMNIPLTGAPAGTFTYLSPWSDWWSDHEHVEIHLRRPGKKRELRLSRRDAGIWVTPGRPGKPSPDGGRAKKRIALRLAESGEVFLRIDNAYGWRKWAVGTLPPLKPMPAPKGRPRRRPMDGEAPSPKTEYYHKFYLLRHEVLRHGRVGRHLNEVKDWVLDWEEKSEHPHLYMTKKELLAVQRRKPDKAHLDMLIRIGGKRQEVLGSTYQLSHSIGAYLITGRKGIAEKANLVGLLDDVLDTMGIYDTWRQNGQYAAFYDAVMSGDLLTPRQRKLFKARFAYLAYRSADPGTWSMKRGYASGNLNMSVANNMLLGMVACAMPDHPMANAWAQPGLEMMEEMLATKVGPAGEWPESVAHYAHVACSALLTFAIAARNAGLADFIADERMKRLQLFLAKHYSPPDPRHTEGTRAGKAAIPVPLGRGTGGEDHSIHGFMARATAQSDPTYSRAMQWLWLRGRPYGMSGDHTMGWEYAVLDPTLPAENPKWSLDYFPRLGAILRHGIGTSNEWYMYLVAGEDARLPGENGMTALTFAKGKPISSRFAYSYPDMEELLLNRVLPARRRGDVPYRVKHYGHVTKRKVITARSDLPRQQYLQGEFTLGAPSPMTNLGPPKAVSQSNFRLLPEWPKVRLPAGQQEGKPGVKWRRQILFVHDDDPAGVGYFVFRDTVTGGQPTMWQFWSFSSKLGALKEIQRLKAPGEKTVPPRRLPQSDRYRAVGQFGVDIDYYIASPTDTPRHTLRFGTKHPFGTLSSYKEWQDLLHLQRSDDGAYFVVVYPRKPREETPKFETLADGKVIRISGRFGSDLCFLSEKTTKAKAEDASFSGTAGSVQDRKNGLVLNLAAGGEIHYGQYALTCKTAAGVRIKGDVLTVELPAGHKGTTVTVKAPGTWGIAEPAEGAAFTEGSDGSFSIKAPGSVASVRMKRR